MFPEWVRLYNRDHPFVFFEVFKTNHKNNPRNKTPKNSKINVHGSINRFFFDASPSTGIKKCAIQSKEIKKSIHIANKSQ